MIGLDLVEVDRIRLAISRTPRFRGRVFTATEIEYCESRGNPYPSYAARFAAKESFRKLHPLFASGIGFHEVEVAMGPEGRPYINLRGEALNRARALGISYMDLSLSHAGQYAVAAIIAVRGDRGDVI